MVFMGDDSGFRLQKNLLNGKLGGGINVDFITYRDNEWKVIELLRCLKTPPIKSHPNYYWHLNKGKFTNLWKLTKDLKGTLILINYEDKYENFKIMTVQEMTENGIMTNDILCNRDEMTAFWDKLNGH